jgi:hemerythrin superfamily protein
MQGECAMARRHDPPKLPTDGIELLQADHREVEDLFRQYQHSKDRHTRQHIADQVCAALELHAHLEETVFYPAFAAAAGEQGETLVEDARQDHQMVRDLIAELEEVHGKKFDAKFRELMHMVQQHVQEEENALFPHAEEALAEQREDLMDEMVELKQHLTPATTS